MYALFGGCFASAHDAGRVHQITNQIALRLEVVGVQSYSRLKFAPSLVSQRDGGKRCESICLLRFAAVGLAKPIVVIGAFGLESDGVFQAGNGAVIIAKLIKPAAQPIM